MTNEAKARALAVWWAEQYRTAQPEGKTLTILVERLTVALDAAVEEGLEMATQLIGLTPEHRTAIRALKGQPLGVPNQP